MKNPETLESRFNAAIDAKFEEGPIFHGTARAHEEKMVLVPCIILPQCFAVERFTIIRPIPGEEEAARETWTNSGHGAHARERGNTINTQFKGREGQIWLRYLIHDTDFGDHPLFGNVSGSSPDDSLFAEGFTGGLAELAFRQDEHTIHIGIDLDTLVLGEKEKSPEERERERIKGNFGAPLPDEAGERVVEWIATAVSEIPRL